MALLNLKIFYDEELKLPRGVIDGITTIKIQPFLK
jgi:hypothetical protein